jgi:hypothetical protein
MPSKSDASDGQEAVMKKYGHFLRFTVPVGLSASLCGAAAQADTWWGTSLKPQYKVEAVRFHCNDETGYDEPWFAPWISDEVRVGISTPAATTISTVFTDVDSGETRSFAPEQSCIYPIDGQSRSGDNVFTPSETWTCANAGSPGPISFTVVMAEEDSGFFHDCLSDFPGCTFSRTDVPDQNDELIGRHTVEFTPEQLAFALPNVGDFIEPVITLTPPGDGSLHAGGPDPAEYMFTYRITRVAVGPLMSDRAAQTAVPTR